VVTAGTPGAPRPRPPRWLVLAAFAAIYFVWGSTYLAIRFAVESIPPLLMIGARFLVAGVVLYLWARVRGAPRPAWPIWRAALIAGTLLLVCGTAVVSWTEQWLASSVASLFGSSDALWMMIGERVGPEKVPLTGRRLAGVALGFSALSVLFAGPTIPGLHGDIAHQSIGAAMLMTSSLLWTVGSIYSRHSALPHDAALSTGMQMLVGGAFCLLIGLATGEGARFDPSAVTARSAAAFAYMVTAGSFIGFTSYVWLLRVSTPTKVATHAFVNPLVAVLLGWSLGHEMLTGRMVLAAIAIIAAVALITTSPTTGGAAEGLQRVE